MAKDDPTFRQIVWGKFDLDAIAGQNPYVILPHFARNVSDDDMSIVQLDAESGIGQGFYDLAFHFNVIFFRHSFSKGWEPT
jgi:hypothetical protein